MTDDADDADDAAIELNEHTFAAVIIPARGHEKNRRAHAKRVRTADSSLCGSSSPARGSRANYFFSSASAALIDATSVSFSPSILASTVTLVDLASLRYSLALALPASSSL